MNLWTEISDFCVDAVLGHNASTIKLNDVADSMRSVVLKSALLYSTLGVFFYLETFLFGPLCERFFDFFLNTTS